jgi:hypothetical protein
MTDSQPDEEAIFHAARDISDPERRREFVREACRGDETLIGRLEAMLAVADAPDSLLDCTPAELLAGETEPAASEDVDLSFLKPSDKPGSIGRLGHYEILEVVGKGGMGTVVRAFDDKLHRVVAI